MKNVIFTACDKNCEEFLVNHWWTSLQKNVDLSNVDVVVIDYGLSVSVRKKLLKEGVLLHRGKRDGFPNAIKFRDIKKFLVRKKYDQVMTCDGADIIFQCEIAPIFNKDKNKMKGVREVGGMHFERRLRSKKDEEIKRFLRDKRVINVGLLVIPGKYFGKLCDDLLRLMKDRLFYGADQALLNYLLYKHGFKELDPKYNFIPLTSGKKFFIKKGVFYLASGGKIPIVHNTGWKDAFRVITDFGYGAKKNRLKKWKYFLLKSVVRALNLFRK